MREDGARGAALALRQLDSINDYISACQVGITMASIGIGAVGEPAIANLLEPSLGNVVAHGVAVAISVAIAYLVITSHPHRVRRAGAEALRDRRARRTSRAASHGRCSGSRVLFTPFIVRAQRRLELRILR